LLLRFTAKTAFEQFSAVTESCHLLGGYRSELTSRE
jgi:hypothetical protein